MANKVNKKVAKDVKKVKKDVKKDVAKVKKDVKKNVKDVKKDIKKTGKKVEEKAVAVEKKVEEKVVAAEKKVEQVEKKVEEKAEKVEKKIDKSTTPRAKEYRRRAREIVKPIKGDFAVTYLVYAVIIGALAGIAGGISMIDPQYYDPYTQQVVGSGIGMIIASALIGAFTLLTTGAFSFSRIHFAKQAHASGEKPKVGGLFFGFKERYTQSLGVSIMTTIFTALWSLLLIIPGIIKSYAYAMSLYIAHDNPGKTTLECITESRKMMKGYKWRLFCLQISHIGWFILVILTLGILSFWVLPKYEQATYEFYLHVSHKA